MVQTAAMREWWKMLAIRKQSTGVTLQLEIIGLVDGELTTVTVASPKSEAALKILQILNRAVAPHRITRVIRTDK